MRRAEKPCEECGKPFAPPKKTRQFCGRSCAGKNRERRRSGDIEARFWSLVDKRGPDECWPWLGTILKATGYGQMRVPGGRKITAHRLAFEIANGPIPSGKLVCHTCDLRWCVNPSHLWLGSNADNLADMAAKGRADRRPGEKHPLSKLTDAAVFEVRARASAGEAHTSIAKEFGVHPSTISAVVRRETWRHLL